MEPLAGTLEAGRCALEAARWQEAQERFEAVLFATAPGDGASASAYEGLGLALWFLGEVAEGITARSTAFELHARAGRCHDAARTAVWIAHQHHVAGRASAARGWVARAERALEDAAEGVGHGWVAVERARQTGSLDTRAAEAERAVRLARRSGADDLEIFALSLLGRCRVDQGRTEEGLVLLEEAMAGASDGRVRNVHTLAEAYCNLIMATTGAGDWTRAVEWCEQVDAFARAKDAAPLFASCRGVHAEVLLATGHWREAEQALETALATHAGHVPAMGAPSVASLAELRIGQGRLAEAEALLAVRAEDPAALRALALLRLAQGRADVAVPLVERGLCHEAAGVAGTSRLLATLVDARLALDDPVGARRALETLTDLAADCGLHLVTGRAELAAARVARAQADPAAAEHARLALVAFVGLAMPLEAGEARVELAHALAAGGSRDAARDEARTALAVFRGLGAAPYVDAAVTLLRDLDAPGGPHATPATLTPREEEVLELVARGYSNARIASTLFISEKTAGHHVSHILAKLGVHNRTEAAARFVARR